MKIIAYSALLYGKNYLEYAIKSVIDHVDEYYVLYAMNPSHGHSGAPSPESEMELLEIAARAAGSKLANWYEGYWNYEGQQRDTILELAPDADVIINLDSDEQWQVNIPLAIEQLSKLNVRKVRIPMVHYWRSFYRCILNDPAYPERITFPKIKDNSETTYRPVIVTDGSMRPYVPHINHFGYAQPASIISYKIGIHGHKNEFRRDCDWFNDVFMANRQTDCHPVGSEFWNPVAVNPMDWMPEYMQSHPFWGKAIIE